VNGLRSQLERAMRAELDTIGHTLSARTIAVLSRAACVRVVWPLIAKLTRERDQARAELAKLQAEPAQQRP
jgi:hypothetical protein